MHHIWVIRAVVSVYVEYMWAMLFNFHKNRPYLFISEEGGGGGK